MLERGEILLSLIWTLPLTAERSRGISESKEKGLLGPLKNELRDQWDSIEGFIVSNEQASDRLVLGGFGNVYSGPVKVLIGNRCQLDAGVILCSHPRYQALSVLFNTKIVEQTDSPLLLSDIDLTIAILRSLQGANSVIEARRRSSSPIICGANKRGEFTSIRAAVRDSVNEIFDAGPMFDRVTRYGWCVELRGDSAEPLDKMVSADPCPYYGLGTSDEGWRYVASRTALARLGASWSTRSHYAAFTLNPGVVCVRARNDMYDKDQENLGTEYFGELETRFKAKVAVAGFEAGAFTVLERVLIRLAMADQTLNTISDRVERQREAARHQPPVRHKAKMLATRRSKTELRTIRDSQLLRDQLSDSTEMLQTVLLPEIAPLERALIESRGWADLLAQLDRRAQSIDEATRYYSELRMNSRIATLTVVAVIIAAVAAILALGQFLVAL